MEMQSSQLDRMMDQTRKQIKQQLQYALYAKDHVKALSAIQKLINIDSENVQHYRTKSMILFNLNRYEQCLKSAETTISMGQKSIQFYNIVIKCHLEMGNQQVIQRNQIQQAQKTIDHVFNQFSPLKHFIHLSQTVQKINNHPFYTLPEEDSKILDQMKNWLYPKGAKYDKVKIVTQTKGYRGAIATKSIKKDEIIVFIPKSQLITLEQAKQNPISKEILKKSIELLSPKHSIISIFLLEERASGKSHFKPYLDILPKDHSCFPINFSTEELTELIGSTFLYQIQEKVFDLKKDYDAICYGSPDFFKKYSFKDFCWARLMVGSRVFGVFINGVKTEILAPFADMLNHKVPKETVWNYSQEKAGFFIQSLKDISIGDELFDSYGKKCNSRFLLNYGFVLEKNDRNQICIKVDFNQKDLSLSKKLEMLKLPKDAKITRIFRITKLIQENNFFELMGFLRFKNIQKIETLNLLQKISNIKKSNQPYNPSRSPPTTMEVQFKIWADLRNLCQSYLNDYPTTLEQDESKLKNTKNLSENMYNILVLRIGQKRLYHHYYELADKTLEILSKGYLEARETARQHIDRDYCRYILKILKLMPHQKNELLKKGIKESTPQLLDEPQQVLNELQEDDEICRDY